MKDPQNLYRLADAIIDQHKNVLVDEVNNHCVRLAVMEDKTYDWHHHPDSDELFIVLDGKLVIEFRDRPVATLCKGDSLTVLAGTIHRTIARGRTVNLCIESTQAKTIFEVEKLSPIDSNTKFHAFKSLG